MNASAYEATMLAKMLFKMLTKASEDPNYIELSKLQRDVYRNCAAVHSALNDNNGHLGLAMSATNYTTRNGGATYVASPTHQGTYDDTIAANAGCAVLQVSKNQLEEALPQWLLGEIKDRDTGLNTVSILDIFNHAFNHRGQIDNDLVDEYSSKYNSPIDMSQGFNAYVKHQKECRDFSRIQITNY
eukprot:1112222-Ditylum_brightwellii.AAC.1